MLDGLFFAAEIDKNIFEIDLHTSKTIVEATHQLEQGLFQYAQNHVQYCKVIHGIGSGKLAEVVHKKLSDHPLVQDWKETPEGGSCYVIL